MLNHPLMFFRHGATDWNLQGRYQGATDTRLSSRGTNQAAENARLVKDLVNDGTFDPDTLSIISSPLQRAQQTANIIAETVGKTLPVQSNIAFRELSLGRWEGLTSAEVKDRFYAERKSRKIDRWNFSPSGGESMAQRYNELCEALKQLPQHSIIVTHAVILRMIHFAVNDMNREQACLYHPPHVGGILWKGAKMHRRA